MVAVISFCLKMKSNGLKCSDEFFFSRKEGMESGRNLPNQRKLSFLESKIVNHQDIFFPLHFGQTHYHVVLIQIY